VTVGHRSAAQSMVMWKLLTAGMVGSIAVNVGPT
jgi:hypothetical protein